MSLHDPKAINVAIVGVGNCASSLVQGLAHYQNGGANDQIGLMHWDLGGYRPKDIKIVAAWDIDRRKVGRDVAGAIFEKPNCTAIFCDHVPESGVDGRDGPDPRRLFRAYGRMAGRPHLPPGRPGRSPRRRTWSAG